MEVLTMKLGMLFALALFAGVVGGVVSRYFDPAAVFAQTSAPKQITAQSFVLVDEKNNLVGVFKSSNIGSGETVVLLDRNGKELWRAGVSPKILAQR